MQPLLILLAALCGLISGFVFRASILPVLSAALIGGILANDWLRGSTGSGTFVRLILAVAALQAGYIIGLWIEQFFRKRQ